MLSFFLWRSYLIDRSSVACFFCHANLGSFLFASEPSALLGNATLKQQLPEVWLAAFDTSTRWRLCGTDLSESQEVILK